MVALMGHEDLGLVLQPPEGRVWMIRSRSRAGAIRGAAIALGVDWRPRDAGRIGGVGALERDDPWKRRSGGRVWSDAMDAPSARRLFRMARPLASYRVTRHCSAQMKQTVTLSESAARRIQAISEREGHPVMLRVAVEGGGCSGFQYQFDLVDAVQDDDLKVERERRPRRWSAMWSPWPCSAARRSISSTNWPARNSACATPTPSPAAAAGSVFRSSEAAEPPPRASTRRLRRRLSMTNLFCVPSFTSC